MKSFFILTITLCLQVSYLFAASIKSKPVQISITTASPAGAPLILFTDMSAGPTSGGEGNQGTYLSLYGINFGKFEDYGVSSFVTIGGQKVANYRCLEPVKSPVYAGLGIKRLTVQVGSAGIQALTAGVSYPISISASGMAPSNSVINGMLVDLDGESLSFTPQPGNILFVDPVNGNDSNPGTFASPLKSLQSSTGYGGALKMGSGANATDMTPPGTHIILRGGNYTSVGYGGRWANLFRITGRPATGAVNRGPIVVTAYPGTAGANVPEVPTWKAPSSAAGGFNGNDSARAVETSTSWGGFTGWSQFIHVSNLHIISNPTGPGDSAPMNLQSSARNWRIVNNELEWRSTVTGADSPRSAGIEGSPINTRIVLNYIHDIYGSLAPNDEADTNHGMYFDGNATGTENTWISFNHIENITAGSGMSLYNTSNSDSFGFRIHHNWIKDVHKHGVNLNTNTRTALVYNNILISIGQTGFNFNNNTAKAVDSTVISNNVVYGWGLAYQNRFALMDEGTPGVASMVRFENNILMQSPGHASNGWGFESLNTDGYFRLQKNRWYDANALVKTKPSNDATGVYGDPMFVSTANLNFNLANGSPCIDAGQVPTQNRTTGFAVNLAPLGGTHDQGAFERAP